MKSLRTVARAGLQKQVQGAEAREHPRSSCRELIFQARGFKDTQRAVTAGCVQILGQFLYPRSPVSDSYGIPSSQTADSATAQALDIEASWCAPLLTYCQLLLQAPMILKTENCAIWHKPGMETRRGLLPERSQRKGPGRQH